MPLSIAQSHKGETASATNPVWVDFVDPPTLHHLLEVTSWALEGEIDGNNSCDFDGLAI
jgi:hypothetical protein